MALLQKLGQPKMELLVCLPLRSAKPLAWYGVSSTSTHLHLLRAELTDQVKNSARPSTKIYYFEYTIRHYDISSILMVVRI